VNCPCFTLIAGANGSGKSTLTSGNHDQFAAFPMLDPDAIAKTIQARVTAGSALAAGRQVLETAASHLRDGHSFAVETTLSGKNYLQMMLDARSTGFEIVLIYIGTESVEINLGRIADRVLAGGHDVPEADVRRRYARSLKNLPIAISRADHAIIFDNSSEQGYQPIGVITDGRPEWLLEKLPTWALSLKVV
jgi:predicted ABC-type ATPase